MDPSPKDMDKMMEAETSCQPEEGAGQPGADADPDTDPQTGPDEDHDGQD